MLLLLWICSKCFTICVHWTVMEWVPSFIYALLIWNLKYLWVCSLIMLRILLVAKNNKTKCTAEQHLFFSNRNTHTNESMWFVFCKRDEVWHFKRPVYEFDCYYKRSKKTCSQLCVLQKKNWKSRQKRIFQQNFYLTAFGTSRRKNYHPNPFELH